MHLVGYLYYWKMKFNSVFKGLMQREMQQCELQPTIAKVTGIWDI